MKREATQNSGVPPDGFATGERHLRWASQGRLMVDSGRFVLAQFLNMQTIRFVLTSVLVAFAVGAVAGQTSEATGAPTEIEKVSRPMGAGSRG